MSLIEIKNLSAEINGKKVLNDINLEFNLDEVNVFLGPNGAGKSTLANVLMGNPKYIVTSGNIYFEGKNITELEADERSKLGLFLSFQNPEEVEGVTLLNFLRTSYNLVKGEELNLRNFIKLLEEKMNSLNMPKSFRSREINVGFSGGEKKRSEILQLLLLEPRFAILDELDSGLDVDALKLIGESIKKLKNEIKTGFMVITHNNKILDYLNVDKVFILVDGSIKKVGSKNLIDLIEKEGFSNIIN
jgi:Fe-S cluster assembly ATP-binding protein